MKNSFKSIFLFFILMISLPLRSESVAIDTEKVNAAVNLFMKKNAIPGIAIELFKEGEPSAYYYGYANVEQKMPVTARTIFEVGSISKIMTSILLAQEVDFAKVQLDTSIKDIITELPDNFAKITLLTLATHTSGLPFAAPRDIQTRTDLEKYLQKQRLALNPERQWQYSDFGMGMLGYALETMTDKDFYQLYRRHILNPLGMQFVIFPTPKKKKNNFAQGYDKNDKPTSHTDPGLFPAAWGVKVSAQDMQRFLAAAIGLPKTPPRILYPMRMTQSIYVKLANHFQGLGWEIHPFNKTRLMQAGEKNSVELGSLPVLGMEKRPYFDGNALIDKTGSTNGFSAYIAVIPNKKSGIVILINKYVPDNEIVNLGREILLQTMPTGIA